MKFLARDREQRPAWLQSEFDDAMKSSNRKKDLFDLLEVLTESHQATPHDEKVREIWDRIDKEYNRCLS